jgi:hypothetical protein
MCETLSEGTKRADKSSVGRIEKNFCFHVACTYPLPNKISPSVANTKLNDAM